MPNKNRSRIIKRKTSKIDTFSQNPRLATFVKDFSKKNEIGHF